MSYFMQTAICLAGYIGSYLAGIFIRSAVSPDRNLEFEIPGIIGFIVGVAVCVYTYSHAMYLAGSVVVVGLIIGFLS